MLRVSKGLDQNIPGIGIIRGFYEIQLCGFYQIKIHRKHPKASNITFLLVFCVL